MTKFCCKKEYKRGKANYPRDPSLPEISRDHRIVLDVDDGDDDCAARRCPCLKHPAWKCIGTTIAVLSFLLFILDQTGFFTMLYCSSKDDHYRQKSNMCRSQG